MPDTAHPLLAGWENFYVIVGSSAAALTGLQFVVIALIAEVRPRSSSQQIEAFGTPTVVHFCVALLISAIVSAPWVRLTSAAIALGAVGIFGVGYASVVYRRTRRQQHLYKPVFEDWLWHVILPFVAYLLTVATSVALFIRPSGALFMVGGGSILLVFIGIHNAWDTVTFITLVQNAPLDAGKRGDGVGDGDSAGAGAAAAASGA